MKELQDLIYKGIDDAFERVRKDRVEFVATALISWVQNHTTKRPLPDLPKRLEDFSKDIRKLAEDMRIKIEKGDLVVKVNGSAEQTLKRLRLGTDWFAPMADDLKTIIMAGLDDRFGS